MTTAAPDVFLQTLFAERIGGERFGLDTAIYKFEKIKRAKRAAQEEQPGVELLDLGVGEPDEMAFPAVVEKLHEEARKPCEPGIFRQRGRRPEDRGRTLPRDRVRGAGNRPGDTGAALHRQQGRALDFACLLH